MTYRERLLPSWWACLLAFVLIACLAIAYGAALGTTTGWIVAGLGIALVIWLLWITAPVVAVDADSVRVGHASIPRSAIGESSVADPQRIRELRGPGSDARIYVELRPWSAKCAVAVAVTDPDDPHPTWLFSSRHPDRVVAALTATM